MAHLIDKDALVAEIEKLKKNEGWCQVGKDTADVYYARGFRLACEHIISFLNTLEVKEVDLEKEIEKCLKQHSMVAVGKKEFTDIAKHFFELGLKAQKGK